MGRAADRIDLYPIDAASARSPARPHVMRGIDPGEIGRRGAAEVHAFDGIVDIVNCQKLLLGGGRRRKQDDRDRQHEPRAGRHNTHDVAA